MQRTNRFIGYATTAHNRKGRTTDDQGGAVEPILVATSATPYDCSQYANTTTRKRTQVPKGAKAQFFVFLSPLTLGMVI